MKNYSKRKLYFRTPFSHIAIRIFLWLMWSFVIVFSQAAVCHYSIIPQTNTAQFVLVFAPVAIVLFLFFVSSGSRECYKMKNIRVGSYAQIHSIIYHGGIRLMISPPDAGTVSLEDVQLAFAEDEFLDELNRQMPDEKWRFSPFVVKFVADEGDLSASDQKRGIVPLVLTNCVASKVRCTPPVVSTGPFG